MGKRLFLIYIDLSVFMLSTFLTIFFNFNNKFNVNIIYFWSRISILSKLCVNTFYLTLNTKILINK